ncbi:MAG: carotenoid biosynthesis protein [Pseudomonadota bacterium]
MLTIELSCAVLLVLYYGLTFALSRDRSLLARQVLVLSTASWLAEDTCIHLYGFYAYSPRWHLFVDQVPLLIALIWPVVIHSAWTLAGALSSQRTTLRALTTAALVFTDAALIEPVAVRADLWAWTHPGVFEVPVIGVLGWALFAGSAAWLLARQRPLIDAVTLLLAPALTHLLLLLCWWSLLRWVEAPIAGWTAAALAWLVSAAVLVRVLLRRTWRRMPRRELMLRIPAALFFIVLLVMHGRDDVALVLYVLAFVPPYLAATPWLPSSSQAGSAIPST